MLHSMTHWGLGKDNNSLNSFKRHFVVAIDVADLSYKAMLWAASDFWRPGDCIHLVHVDRCQQPQMTIQHNYPGATYTIPNLTAVNDVKHGQQVGEVIKARFLSVLEERHIPYVMHLYLDTDNAPASAVATTIFKVAQEVDAVLIVLAAHNKAYGWNDFLLGSVADYVMQNSNVPVMLVRNYQVTPATSPTAVAAQRVVIPWASPKSSSTPASPAGSGKLDATVANTAAAAAAGGGGGSGKQDATAANTAAEPATASSLEAAAAAWGVAADGRAASGHQGLPLGGQQGTPAVNSTFRLPLQSPATAGSSPTSGEARKAL